MSTSAAEAGPSELPELPQPPPPPPPPNVAAGTETVDTAGLDAAETKAEEDKAIYRVSDDQIASEIEKSDELPSYNDLVKSGEVKSPDGSNDMNLTYINVCIQLAKFCGQQAIKTFNEYKAKNIHLPLGNMVEQALGMVKILAVVRVCITELKLSDDTYLYLQTASEYLGCQMLVRYAILKKNPLMFRSDDGTSLPINLVLPKYQKMWLKLAQMLTNPDFTKLSKEAKAAKIDIVNGEFHLLLFKMIDPDYSNHAGRRISRFIDKVFGTPQTKECTSGLCNLSPEAMKAIKYTCTCKESKYHKKKREGQPPGELNTHPLP